MTFMCSAKRPENQLWRGAHEGASWKYSLLHCCVPTHPSTHAVLPVLKNRTGVSGRSCEKEPCPGQTLQLSVPRVIQESGQRRGHFHPQDVCSLHHFLSHDGKLVSKGQCRPEDAEMCSLLTLLQGYPTYSWFGYSFQLIFLYTELLQT